MCTIKVYHICVCTIYVPYVCVKDILTYLICSVSYTLLIVRGIPSKRRKEEKRLIQLKGKIKCNAISMTSL